MNIPDKFNGRFTAPRLTRGRIGGALAVGVIADGLQLFLGPLGWAGADQIIDLIAMGLTMWLLGFHLLLLPTFIVELIPGVDMLPTWTGCAVAVIALRKREQRNLSENNPPVVEPPPDKRPPRIGNGASDQGTWRGISDTGNSSYPDR